MAKKKKYYVVWNGVTPGVYHSWADCQVQIKGYPNAKYKSFGSLEEAEDAFLGGHQVTSKTKKKVKQIDKSKTNIPYIADSWSVDAACSGNPGIMEYRGVHTSDRSEIFRQGPFRQGTNNIGEFLAIIHALALLKKKGMSDKVVYTDSRTALAWIKHKRVKTTLKKTRENAVLFELIERGEKWVKENQITNPIYKWPTKIWGEIPADFDRK